MARYFLHLRDGHDETPDPDGCDYAGLEALDAAMILAVRELTAIDVVKGRLRFDLRIDAEDGDGNVVHSVGLPEAVTISGR